MSPKITSRGSHEYSYFTHFYKATLSPLICAPPSHISVTLTAFVINYFLVRPKTLGLTHFFIFWKSISLFLVLWKINVYKYWFEINIYTNKYFIFFKVSVPGIEPESLTTRLHRILSSGCFDQPSFGLWARRASSAPRWLFDICPINAYIYHTLLDVPISGYQFIN